MFRATQSAQHETRGSLERFATAKIHGYYHGGSDMEHVVTQICADVSKRSVVFPDWDSLQVPVRDAASVTQMTASDDHSLLTVALHGILVHEADWHNTRMALMQRLAKFRDQDSTATYRVLKLGPGARSFLNHKAEPQHPKLRLVANVMDELGDSSSHAIAVVGLSVNYPNGCTKETFWESLKSGANTVKEIPASRFDVSQYYDDTESNGLKRKMHTKYGNFIDAPFDFDPKFFNMSPREAKSMDPQQRVLLQASLDALEDAGYTPDSTPSNSRESFGVYVGVATGDYVDNLREDIDVYYSPGTLRAFLAGKISYAFQWSGPSMVIDTACSSSAAAIYQACKALESGDCTAALAGGVNVISSPDMYLGLDRAHFLSPSGQCKPWDATADGYCRSEGCGLVVLKKLADAESDGDHIYGVIRGYGVNQSGCAKSITHPDEETQASLFRQVLQSSRVDPDSISVVEAHGTGTQAGDYCECNSLGSVFQGRSKENPLYLASIKGNIGHSEAASGVAGLNKLLLMLENRQIPPQASHITLNPRLEGIKTGQFTIPTELVDWMPRPSRAPRRALLNNFGAAGSNVALIVEEYLPMQTGRPSKRDSVTTKQRSLYMLNLSAKSEEALKSLWLAYSNLLLNSNLPIEEISYSANARRQLYRPYRAAFSGKTAEDLIQSLENGAIDFPGSDNRYLERKQKTVFVFSGQGGMYPGVGRELFSTTDQFRDVIVHIDTILVKHGFPKIQTYINGSTEFSELPPDQRAIVEQIACFSLEYALAKLWMCWGVNPDMVVGHSIGEYAALAISGILTMESALLLVAKRASLMTRLCGTQSRMCAVSMESESLSKLLSSQFPQLEIACYNSPTDHVISGQIQVLDNFEEYCRLNGFQRKRLPTPYGFHSKAMDPILNHLDELAESVDIQPPKTKFGSSLYGRTLKDGENIHKNFFSKHAREAVKFCSAITELGDQFSRSNAFVVEIGPSPSTKSMFRKTLDDRLSYNFLTSLSPKKEPWNCLSHSLQTLFMNRYPVNWRAVYDIPRHGFISSLPRYPLDKNTYLVKYEEPIKSRVESTKGPTFSLVESLCGVLSSPGSQATSTTRMDQISKYITAHAVGGVPLCPASIYIEISMEAMTLVKANVAAHDSVYTFEDLSFDTPLIYSDSEVRQIIKTLLRVKSNETLEFDVSSSGGIHCAGSCSSYPSNDTASQWAASMGSANELKNEFCEENQPRFERFLSRTIYNMIFPRVVEYSDPFLTIQNLTISTTGLKAHGWFQLPPPIEGEDHVHHPAFADTMLHAAGFLANTHCDTNIACICASIKHVAMKKEWLKPPKPPQMLELYTSIVENDNAYIGSSYVLNDQNELIAYIEGMAFKKLPLRSFKAYLSRLKSHSTPQPVRPLDSPTVVPNLNPELYPGNPIQEIVRSLVLDITGGDQDPKIESSLEELGIDSLLCIELADAISVRFPSANLSKPELEACSSIYELVQVVVSSTCQTPSPSALMSFPDSTLGSSPVNITPTPSTPLSSADNDFSYREVKRIIEEACGLIMTESDRLRVLGELGVDSLLSIEVFHELQDKLDLKIEGGPEAVSSLTTSSIQELYASKKALVNPVSFEKVSEMVRRAKVDFSSPSTSSDQIRIWNRQSPLEIESSVTLAREDDTFPIQLQHGPFESSHSDLYLFHDGSGLSRAYTTISTLNRDVFVFYSPVDMPMDAETLEELASVYIERSSLQRRDNVILGGKYFTK